MNDKISVRNSSIELYKIAAMFMIVVFHVNMTLEDAQLIPPFHGVGSVFGITNLALQFISYLGFIGNEAFWICSCWFFVSDDRMSCRKAFYIIADVWVVSMLFFLPSLRYFGFDFLKDDLLWCMFPTLFSNNWYVTCYLLVFGLHPLLNRIIAGFNKRTYLRFVIALIMIYCVSGLFYKSLFFYSWLIGFIIVYFIVGYLKLYCPNFCDNFKLNVGILLVCLLALLAYEVFFEILATAYGIASVHDYFWKTMTNPFVMMAAFSLLNIARHFKFKNRAVNYISALTLFIYIFHENLIVRNYLRKSVWEWIAGKYGVEHILLEHLVYAGLLFIASAILSAIYKETIRRVLLIIYDPIYNAVAMAYKKVESKLVNFS